MCGLKAMEQETYQARASTIRQQLHVVTNSGFDIVRSLV
jgi:hypothetical protein